MADAVRQMDIEPGMSVEVLVERMGGCGFGARRLALAVDIYEEMLSSRCTKFLTLSGALVPAGMREIVSGLIRRGHVDVLVTTGANLVHDIIETVGPHLLGNPDAEDSCLREEGLSRIYDVYISDDQFIKFEEIMQAALPDRAEPISGPDLLRCLGPTIDDRRSILRSAYDMGVPIFCPALADSMIGLQAWLHRQTKKLRLDPLAELNELIDICYESERSGIVILGGGVPKNFCLQAMLVTPRSYELAIQLTTDHPEAGGLSGATLSEAVSWGKIAPSARFVTVYGDATINLPILVSATLSRLANSNHGGGPANNCGGR